jgi:hypothetical protein
MANAMCTVFKQQILQGYHCFGTGVRATDSFKIALYTSLSGVTPASASTATYAVGTPTDEVPNGTGYTTGGNPLVNPVTGTQSTTQGYASFDNIAWTSATFSTIGALIYNSTQGNKAICVLDFGTTKTVSSGTFTIQFPTPPGSPAVIQIV